MSKSVPAIATQLRVRQLLVILMTGSLLAGCGTYVPKGATVISVKNSKREYERADLRPPENELTDARIIPMKWYDTNTFLTTATLSPGVYSFRARNYDGAAIVRDVTIVPDKDLYEIMLESADAAKKVSKEAPVEGPEVKGRLLLSGQGKKEIRDVSVLFIGKEIIMRTSRVGDDGSFSVKAPEPGSWKMEVHALGPVPKSYTHPLTQVTGPVNLGNVALK